MRKINTPKLSSREELSSLRRQGSHDTKWIPAFAGMTYLKCILLFLFLLIVASCSTWRQQGQTPKKKTEGTITRTTPVKKEVMKPSGTQLASISSPARSASMDMVTKGKELYDSGNFDKALGKFEEAVVIDSGNGVAYYYIAKTRFKLGKFDEAMGILDKAEALLGSSKEWSEAVSVLRTQIIEKNSTSYPPS